MAEKSPMTREEAEKVHQALKKAHPSLGMSIDDAGEHNGVGVWCVAIVPPIFGDNRPGHDAFLQQAQKAIGRELPDAAVHIRAIERPSRGFVGKLPLTSPGERER